MKPSQLSSFGYIPPSLSPGTPSGQNGYSVSMQFPDFGTVGGNTRGVGSADFQMSRTAATQVASGAYSFVAGQQNTVASINSAAFGYNNNIVSTSSYSFAAGYGNVFNASASSAIALGSTNTVNGGSAIALGYSNTANGGVALGFGNTTSTYGYGLGYFNNCSGTYSIGGGGSNASSATGTAAFGSSNTASANYSVALGYSCTASGIGSVAMGRIVSTYGPTAQANDSFSYGPGSYSGTISGKFSYASGDSLGANGAVQGLQFGILVLRTFTTSNTPTVLVSDASFSAAGTNNQLVLSNYQAVSFRANIVARQQGSGGTNSAAWEIAGLIRREGSAATTTLVSSTTSTISNVPGWSIAVSADTTNGALAVTATGAAATNIRWVCSIIMSEVVYP